MGATLMLFNTEVSIDRVRCRITPQLVHPHIVAILQYLSCSAPRYAHINGVIAAQHVISYEQ